MAVSSQIVHAHSDDYFAGRWRKEGGFTFRVRGVRSTHEGRWVDEDPPEVLVMDLLPTCEYCGSLTIGDFLDALETPGTSYSGSDWKYGYPHKFYVEIPCEPYRRSSMGRYYTDGEGRRVVESTWTESTTRNHRFYTEHLKDATPDELERWARVAQPLLGIAFELTDDGRLMYRAPRVGYQAYGTV